MTRWIWVGMATWFVTSVGAEEPAPFTADWESLSGYECPDWFRDGKLGIYAHWGIYSVPRAPGNSDWYSRRMYRRDHENYRFHRDTYGEVDQFGYKDFTPKFTAENFNADEWADLMVECGARFGGPVGEHADGFSMWASKVNPWNAAAMGPRRDIVAEMEKAVRARGLKFLVSLHHSWNWAWYPTWDEGTDCADPKNEMYYGPRLPASARHGAPLPTAEWERVWLEKVNEVIEGYSPDVLWFDNRMKILSEGVRQQMAAHFLNHAARRGQDVVLNFKRPDLPLGVGTVDLERSRMPDIYPEPWLTDTSISRSSWSWTSDLECYSTDRLIHDLIDIVSKNGCMLLNIAPHPDGSIPAEQQQRLREMGAWLKLNGEAIYASRPWIIFGEGPTETKVGHLSDKHFDGFAAEDIRFTTRDGQLYAIALGWPDNREVRIKSLGRGRYNEPIERIYLIGHQGALKFEQNEGELVINLPKDKPCEHAFVFKINR